MTSSAADDTYCNEIICCIEDFMSEKSCPLPAVVRVTPSDYEVPDSDEEIPTQIEFLLSKLDKIKFVRVKVLPFDKEDQMIASKGIEFARRRSELVGREFFLPAEYQGSVRCIPRPGSRKSFTTIKEVLEALPRYIKFNTDSPSCNASGNLNKGQKVASGSVLILSKISTFKDSAFRFLTCSIGNTNFLFREDQEVNLEALDDGQLHNFSELSCLPVLPIFIQLGYVSPTEIVCEEDDTAESLLTVLSGPLEVTQFLTSTMLLAWTSNGENKPCTKVLLLRKSARDRSVLLHASFSDEEAKAYIEQHFRDFNKTEWLRKSMYALHADKTNTETFIWLKRPLTKETKPVASVKPLVATKLTPFAGRKQSYIQGHVASKQENIPPASPGKCIPPEAPEKDTKWAEWKTKIKGIHKELILFLKKESTSRTGSRGQDYLHCVPEKENESGQQIMVITDTNLTTPKAHGGPERQTSISSKTNTFDSSTNATFINSLKAVGQSQEIKTPMPNTQINTDRLMSTAPQGSLKPCSPCASLTASESNTDTNAGDAVITSVAQPLTSPRYKPTHKQSDDYVNVKDTDLSSEVHLTTCTNQQSINNSHELSPTPLSQSAQCTLKDPVKSDIVDRTNKPPHIPPTPHTSFAKVTSNNIIDTTIMAVNKDNSTNSKIPPKPSAKLKSKNRDKNNELPLSGIYLEDPGDLTCVTPSLPMSPRFLSDASLADISRSSPLSPQMYPGNTDETSVLYPESTPRSVHTVSVAITESQSETSLHTNMGSQETILTLKTPPIKVKPKKLPKPINDDYEEMIKCDNETFVLNLKSGMNPSGSSSNSKLSVQPRPFAQDDNENSVSNVTVRKNTTSYTDVSYPPMRPSLFNSDLEHLDDKDNYDEIMDPLNTLSDNEVNQEGSSEFTTVNVDVTKVMRTRQTKEHFYDYSVLDVHECFKMCFPENIEISNLTLEYRLDGEFFRDDGLESFCETANVGRLQKKKLMKIINHGWRPKL